jgi:integrase
MTDYIADHCTHLEAAGYSQQTVDDRKRLLRHVDAALPRGLYYCARQEIETYLARKLSPSSRAIYYRHLKGFWDDMCAGEAPYFAVHPMAGMKRPRFQPGLPNPVTEEDLQWCLERSTGQMRLAITIAAHEGLRRAEIVALEREDVTADRIHIRRGKGGQEAYVPTMPAVWAMVEPMPPGPLFHRRDGRPVTARWLGSLAAEHFRTRLRRPDIHLHRFRHLLATRLTAAGVPTAVVATALRHRDLNSTARYIGVSEQQARDAMLSSLPGPSDSRPGQTAGQRTGGPPSVGCSVTTLPSPGENAISPSARNIVSAIRTGMSEIVPSGLRCAYSARNCSMVGSRAPGGSAPERMRSRSSLVMRTLIGAGVVTVFSLEGAVIVHLQGWSGQDTRAS